MRPFLRFFLLCVPALRRRGHVLALPLLLLICSAILTGSRTAQADSTAQVATHAQPSLSAHTVENFYDVLRWSLKDVLVPSSASADGHPAAGLTRAELTLRKQLLAQPGGCRAVELSIIIEITITMPRWAGPVKDMPEDMHAALAHLRAHEQVHRDHAVQAGARLAQALAGLPLDQTCARLQNTISQHLHRQLFHLRQRGEVFDQLTDFGRRGLPKTTPQKRPPPTLGRSQLILRGR